MVVGSIPTDGVAILLFWVHLNGIRKKRPNQFEAAIRLVHWATKERLCWSPHPFKFFTKFKCWTNFWLGLISKLVRTHLEVLFTKSVINHFKSISKRAFNPLKIFVKRAPSSWDCYWKYYFRSSFLIYIFMLNSILFLSFIQFNS